MKILTVTTLLTIIFFTSLRFYDIEADFPARYTDGGFVHTDEGWYCNGATSKILTGKWSGYGFQSMPVMPAHHLAQYATMSVFGVSAKTARYTTSVLFTLLLIGLFMLVKSFSKPSFNAMIAITPVATSSYLFSYSRIALPDMGMLALATWALCFAAYGNGLPAAAFMIAAVLTKLTALFALPVFALLLWRKDPRASFWSTYAVLLLCGLYFAITAVVQPSTFGAFFSANITDRSGLAVLPFLSKFPGVDAPLIICCGIAASSIKGKNVVIPALLLLSGALMLSANTYQPIRYFGVFTIALSLFIGVSDMPKRGAWIILVLCIVFNGAVVGSILTNRSYTLRDMCASLRREKSVSGPLANTVSLYSRVPSTQNARTYPARPRDVEKAVGLGYAPTRTPAMVNGTPVYILGR